jgi:chromosome segregation ATPase
MKIHCVFACTLLLAVFLYFANIGSGIGGDVSSSKDSASTVVWSEPDQNSSGTPSAPAENEAKNEVDSTAGQLDSAIDSENQAGDVFDGSPGRSERDAPESKSEELERKLEALKIEIASIKSDIAVERAALDKDKVMLDALEAEIEASDPSPYSQDEIDVHNAKVRRHERLRVEFNSSVRSYNQKIELEKKKVQKHNEIVDDLNSRR